MKELKIQKNEAGQRLDKFLRKYLDEAPGSFIYKMLRKKNITLNKKKATGREMLVENDEVSLYLSDDTITKFQKRKTVHHTSALKILYEDEDIAVVNKPAGMLCQTDRTNRESLAELLVAQLLDEGKLTDGDLRAFRPAPVNRLDRNTSGIVLCGTSLRGLQFLSEILRTRDARKEYLAITSGILSQTMEQIVYFEKDERSNRVRLYDEPGTGRGIMKTGFYPVSQGADATLVRVHLITGKTHQIRAHLSYLQHPILGDPKYGSRQVNEELQRKCGVHRQMLHAWRVTFPDVRGDFSYLSGKSIMAPLPGDMKKVCRSYGLAFEGRVPEVK